MDVSGDRCDRRRGTGFRYQTAPYLSRTRLFVIMSEPADANGTSGALCTPFTQCTVVPHGRMALDAMRRTCCIR